jgi:hypothetical protein
VIDDLVAAWEAWDARPGDVNTTRRLVAICHVFAGSEAIELRKHMSAALGAGLSRKQALVEWELLHG